MQTIIIEVRGGVVQEVYSDASDLRVVLVDWDKDESQGDNCEGGTFSHKSFDDLPIETRDAAQHLTESL